MATPTNVQLRSFDTGVSGNWVALGAPNMLICGSGGGAGHRHVVEIKFTLPKAAQSVTFTLRAGAQQYTSTAYPLSYKLLAEESSYYETAPADAPADGTFYWTNIETTVTFTINRACAAGTHYLYVFLGNDGVGKYNQLRTNYETAVIYEELVAVVPVSNGSTFENYEIYISNGSTFERYAAFVANGSSFDAC